MQSLEELSSNVQSLLERYKALQAENAQLRELNEQQRQEMLRSHSELLDLQQRNRHLLEANAMLGSPEERELAKRRITALINQVDKAIETLKQ